MSQLKSYITGFVLSILLTIAAYLPVQIHLNSQHQYPSHHFIIIFILILAMAQLLVQLILFLHLGREKKPRWNFWVFVSAAGLILIVIIGSIWIMNHLNYNMSPDQMNKYIQSQDGF